MKMPRTNQSAHDFWDELYQEKSPTGSGKPSKILEKYAAGRTTGIALDLGCARGDDTIWMAKQGWIVTAVDISPTALAYAKTNATHNGVADKITFKQHDLTKTFPDIQCDLISAMFLQTPFDFPRAKVFKRAVAALRPGGLLLIATHGWKNPNEMNSSAQDDLDELNLNPSEWTQIYVGSSKRKETDDSDQPVKHFDNIIAIERK